VFIPAIFSYVFSSFVILFMAAKLTKFKEQRYVQTCVFLTIENWFLSSASVDVCVKFMNATFQAETFLILKRWTDSHCVVREFVTFGFKIR